MKQKLPKSEFIKVVRNAPLVSIDLLIYNEKGDIGLGKRRNQPARGYYYFPGGRIYKDEKFEEAAGRILMEEIGVIRDQIPMTVCGVNNWFFDTNFAGVRGVTTHYVALAIVVQVQSSEINNKFVNEQHDHFLWITEDHALEVPMVHDDVKHVIRHLQEVRKNRNT